MGTNTACHVMDVFNRMVGYWIPSGLNVLEHEMFAHLYNRCIDDCASSSSISSTKMTSLHLPSSRGMTGRSAVDDGIILQRHDCISSLQTVVIGEIYPELLLAVHLSASQRASESRREDKNHQKSWSSSI